MKVKNILNKIVTVLPTVDGYTYNSASTMYTQINRSLKWVIDLGKEYEQPINSLREMEYHSDKQKSYKVKFPCWFVGGTFPLCKTEDKDIIEYSNLLAIDIDKIDNPDINLEDIKTKLFSLSYVFMVSKSISGEGIYALILIENGKYTKEYYNYISKLWHNQFGLNIDEQCTNIGRKRFISFDDNLMLKDEETEITEWKLRLKEVNETKESNNNIQQLHYSKYTTETDNKKLTHNAIWYLLNNGYSIDDINSDSLYGVWYHIGCDFRHFDDGEDMFVKFSTNSSKYNDSINEISKKWRNTKIEKDFSEVSRKWCGICKRKYGKYWINIVR